MSLFFFSFFLNGNSQSKYFSKYVSLKFRVHLNTSKHYIADIAASLNTFFRSTWNFFFATTTTTMGRRWRNEENRLTKKKIKSLLFFVILLSLSLTLSLWLTSQCLEGKYLLFAQITLETCHIIILAFSNKFNLCAWHISDGIFYRLLMAEKCVHKKIKFNENIRGARKKERYTACIYCRQQEDEQTRRLRGDFNFKRIIQSVKARKN